MHVGCLDAGARKLPGASGRRPLRFLRYFFHNEFLATNPCSAPILFRQNVCLFRLNSNVFMYRSAEGEDNGSIQPDNARKAMISGNLCPPPPQSGRRPLAPRATSSLAASQSVEGCAGERLWVDGASERRCVLVHSWEY
eukprot:1023612-Prymnesium_polylepis.1